eukprot:gene8384-biopygen3783
MIASGQAAEFYRLKKADPANVPCSTPMEFFGNRFIQRFFEVHPIAAPMFSKTSMKQGTLFFRMVSFTIAALDDDSKFDSQFVTLAKSHNRMGIRAVESDTALVYRFLFSDGIFGECLFWVLKQTLGPEYDAMTHMGWVKIFSRVLKAMVPVAVEYELENKTTMKSRVTSRFQALTTTLDQQAALKGKLHNGGSSNSVSSSKSDGTSSLSSQSMATITLATLSSSS